MDTAQIFTAARQVFPCLEDDHIVRFAGTIRLVLGAELCLDLDIKGDVVDISWYMNRYRQVHSVKTVRSTSELECELQRIKEDLRLRIVGELMAITGPVRVLPLSVELDKMPVDEFLQSMPPGSAHSLGDIVDDYARRAKALARLPKP